mgnify:CR=1 FL=1
MRAALPVMKARGGGSVVVGGSIAAMKGFPNHAAYCASKGALLALVRQAAIDYAIRTVPDYFDDNQMLALKFVF